MKDHSKKDVERIEEQAKKDERDAQKAKKELKKALYDMHPQREHHTREKGPDK
ncbi:hypothetical protein LC040_00325 [Bacillus tianshenii]|nr:hypothetical protein LC040_00325 [Bacillus tianshenii]